MDNSDPEEPDVKYGPEQPVDAAATEEFRVAHGRRLQKDMVKGSLWTAVQALVGLPMAFFVNLVVARSLGPDGLGRLATFVAGYALVGRLLNLGWGEATVQWLATARAEGRQDAEVEIVRDCAGYHTFFEGPILGTLTFLALWSSSVTSAVVAAAAVWLTQAAGTSTVIMTATARNAFAAKLALIVNTATQIATLSVVTTSALPAAIWAAQLAVAATAPVFALLRLEPWLRRAVLRPRLPRKPPHGFLLYAVSACASGLVSTLVYGRSELFVLRADGLVGAAGIFVIITGLASQITIPMDALMGPLTPTAVGLLAASPARAADALSRSLRVSALLGAMTASAAVPLTFVLLAPAYGDAYSEGRFGLVVLVLVSCLQSVAGPLGSFAFATRSAAAVLRTNLVCLVLDAAVAFTVIPVLGIWGAVLANATSQGLSLFLLARIVRTKMSFGGRLVMASSKVFPVGALVGGLDVGVCSILPPDLIWQIALAAGGPLLLILCLRHWEALRLTSGDAHAIANGLPARLGALGMSAMSRLSLVRPSAS